MSTRPKIHVDYCITREGVIDFPLSLASDNQCVNKFHQKYYYTCELYANNQNLNKQGFITDHNDIDRAITEGLIKSQFKGSCELMVEKIISIVIKLLKDKKMDFSSIKITLKGNKENNPAFITGSYKQK